MAKAIAVARVQDVPEGESRVVEVNGRKIALFNAAGHFYALDNSCLHRGGPLGEGFLGGKMITCPWHGWQYDVSTGANTLNPAMKVQRYQVEVDGSEVRILA